MFQDEHTRYEWAVLNAAYELEPWGEERDDLRGAYHTAHIMAAFAKVDDMPKLIHELQLYLKQHFHDEHDTPKSSVTIEDAARIL